MENLFTGATRKQTKIKIGLDGPSGSGKTYSALLIAKGLGERIAFVDTEGGSGSLYADNEIMPEYDVLNLTTFDPKYYIGAIDNAIKQNYDVLIIDSLSHAWMGKGGILEKQTKASMGGEDNNFTAWRKVTPLHNQLVDALIQSQIHIIATLRTQTAWDFEEYKTRSGETKKKPKKIGLKPMQREGLEYEFTLMFDLNDDNYANASKDRTALFKGEPLIITEDTGRTIKEWILKGKEVKEPTLQDHFLNACSTNDNVYAVSKMLERAGIEQFKARQHYHNAIIEYCDVTGMHIQTQEQLNGFKRSPNEFFNGFIQWRIAKTKPKQEPQPQPAPTPQETQQSNPQPVQQPAQPVTQPEMPDLPSVEGIIPPNQEENNQWI